MPENNISFKAKCAGMIGNILEHYDNALFGLLAPFIAPLFFSEKDPITALIMTYGMLSLGLCARPLGAFFIGWIGDVFGRRSALRVSLIGMACVTVSIGFLPTYAQAGVAAPVLLALARVLQNFFAAGESIGGAIFVLEHTASDKKNIFSGIYDASSIGGVMLASLAVTLLGYCGKVESHWRILFFAGASTAILGAWLRDRQPGIKEKNVERALPSSRKSLWALRVLWRWRSSLLAVIVVSGFSYMIYSLSFTLMNGFIPLVTAVTKTEVLRANTVLLIFDLLLLPLFGWLANVVTKERLMLFAAGFAALSCFPLFMILENASFPIVIIMRVALVTLGVAFSATYHSWTQELIPAAHRYTIISVGYAIGSQLIGAPSVAISLWLFRQSGWIGAPALCFFIAASLAAIVVYKFSKSVSVLASDLQSGT